MPKPIKTFKNKNQLPFIFKQKGKMSLFAAFIKNDSLALQADHLFTENMAGGNKERAMLLMAEHVKAANSIFKNTDFSDDNKADGKVIT